MKISGICDSVYLSMRRMETMGWAPYNWNLVREAEAKKDKEKAEKKGKETRKATQAKEEKTEGNT